MESSTPPAAETGGSASFASRAHPGVYITEIAASSPSVVGVATAVPAFIGYTQTAAIAGKSVLNQPVPITSLEEYEQTFGAAPQPKYRIQTLDEPAPGSFSVLNPTVEPPATVFFTLAAEGQRYNLYDSLQLFYANGGGACYVVSVGSYDAPVAAADLLRGLDAVAAQAGPTMLVIPDAVLLPPDDPTTPWVSSAFSQVAQAMLRQADTLQDRIAILDVYGTGSLSQARGAPPLDTVIAQFRDSVGGQGLSYGAAYFPFLATTMVGADGVSLGWIDNTPPVEGKPGILQDILSWEAMNLFPDGPGSPNPERWSIQHQVDTIPTTADPGAVDQALREKIPLLGQMEQWMADDQNVLPPGAAVAGLVTKVDAAEGPWVSPANVALTGVTQPTYPLTDSQQQGLTVPPDGRSVDAIRAFAGRGTVVWGGRTLDGNSNDYRYIQVRRTIIYIEQSIKNALEQFVFAPNDASTWTAVVSMVSAFLQQVWGLGGLVGSRPSEAFTVTCGLGSTMTSQDVLDGSMIVEVSVAVVRPAEFIELTFQQQMQSPS